MKQYKEVLKGAEASLSVSGQEPRIASIVLEELFGMNFTQLTLRAKEMMPQGDYDKFQAVIERVCRDEPYQYVLGEAYFYDAYFKVTPATLIPRNETEELVALILEREPDRHLTVADIGTGTGAIGLTLQRHWSTNKLILTDLSKEALDVAKENAERLGVTAEFKNGNLFEPFIEDNIKVDVIVSNPPYISEDAKHLMTSSVLLHEPAEALFAADDGLALYKKMVRTLPDILNDGGRVYFEIGFDQADTLKEYIERTWPKTEVHVVKDINQQDRILHFKWGEQYD